MKISDLIKMGLRNLTRRKARTLLTVIGVIIGTVSIVVMVSIGVGMQESYTASVMESGSLTKITVKTWPENFDKDGNRIDSKEQKLNADLVDQIKKIEHVKAVTPIKYSYMQLQSGKYNNGAQIYAMDCETMEDFEFPTPIEGELPTPEKRDVMIVGAYAIRPFYNWSSRSYQEKEIVLGKDKVTMSFSEYQINEKKKPFSLELKNFSKLDVINSWQMDNCIWMDYEYFTEIYLKYANTLKLEERKRAVASLENYEEIWVNVDNINNVLEVQNAITALGFISDSKMKELEPMQKTSDMLQIVLGIIGGVAMFVSAINIANTMIMSIYERTKEIGIMKVLGCQVRDIKKLFLFEAALIGLIGGIIGNGISYVASWAINKFGGPVFGALMQGNYMYDVETAKFSSIPFYLPFLAALLTIGVGLISGYMPARRATKISAIEAMKTEG